MFLVHGAVVSQMRLKTPARFGHPAPQPSNSESESSLLPLLLRLPLSLRSDVSLERPERNDRVLCWVRFLGIGPGRTFGVGPGTCGGNCNRVWEAMFGRKIAAKKMP